MGYLVLCYNKVGGKSMKTLVILNSLDIVPKTGDNLGWLIWLIIGIIVLAAVIAVVTYFVKKKKNGSKSVNENESQNHAKK